MSVRVEGGDKTDESLGTCFGISRLAKPTVQSQDGRVFAISDKFSVPSKSLHQFWWDWTKNAKSKLTFVASPLLERHESGESLSGDFTVVANSDNMGKKPTTISYDVTCRSSTGCTGRSPELDPFVFRVSISVSLVDGRFPQMSVALEPRAKIENLLPIRLDLRSPMPYLFGRKHMLESDMFTVEANSSLEIFTPGPSIAINLKCSDNPVGGCATTWMKGGWIDLPLVPELRLLKPQRCTFPFSTSGTREQKGTQFFVTQGKEDMLNNTLEEATDAGRGDSAADNVEVALDTCEAALCDFHVTQCFFAVDHTGEVLFQEAEASSIRTSQVAASLRASQGSRAFDQEEQLPPLGAYRVPGRPGRVSLLPPGNQMIQLLHLSMEGHDGLRRSAPFKATDISICEGGVDSTAIQWQNGSESGFCAYRQLINEHQSEIHIIPDYIVFNGSEKSKVRIRQPGGIESIVEPGSISPLRSSADNPVVISVECIEACGWTAPMKVDTHGLRVAIVRNAEGFPIGSLAIQTVVGSRDSKFVVKLGELKQGEDKKVKDVRALSLLERDFLRFRVQWTEFQLSLHQSRPVDAESALVEAAMDQVQVAAVDPSAKVLDTETSAYTREKREQAANDKSRVGPVCTILFHRFTVDWQRVFKEDSAISQGPFQSLERSQLSIIIHNFRISDDTPNTPFPIVFDSNTDASFFDLCVRCKGPLNADLIKVDIFDLKLAHRDGVSDRIILKTSEAFVWQFLDLAERISAAVAELADNDIELSWDEDEKDYKVVVQAKEEGFDEETQYAPPKSDVLLDINRARVSPFTVVVSFKRSPEAKRYTLVKGSQGANLMNYFTRQLKFQIDKAELKFKTFEVHAIKGPPDRLIELIQTEYLSRIKMKLFTIMTSASFQDWKFMAARDDGDDSFKDGDILRSAGNLSGKTANLLFRKTGKKLGSGVSYATGTLGDGIESATDAMGMRPLGAGVNSVVSGVGDGVADTLSGGTYCCAVRTLAKSLGN